MHHSLFIHLHLLKDILIPSRFWQKCCYKHSCCTFLCGYGFSDQLSKYLGTKLFTLVKNRKTTIQSGYNICISNSNEEMNRSSHWFTSSLAMGIVSFGGSLFFLFSFNHFNKSIVISPCLTLHILNDRVWYMFCKYFSSNLWLVLSFC